MRSTVIFLFLIAWGAIVFAQQPPGKPLAQISGGVEDPLGKPVEGAKVVAGDSETSTGADGRFLISIPYGKSVLRIHHSDFQLLERVVDVSADMLDLKFVLEPILRYPESIVVQAIRAESKTPVTKKDIDRDEIESRNYGQEMPFFLTAAPSITSYSDSGIGAGYSYFTMRGIQQTRINMTVDGVPLNDPEESAVYFANFGDFTNSLKSIQIQRGVGTSTMGAASYGGSINFESLDPSETRDISGEVGAGSYGTSHASLMLGSGRLSSGLALHGRMSYQDTDGFKYHSGVNQRAIYYGGTWQGERSFLKFFGFDGREKTNLAFLATEEDILKQDLRYNALQPEEVDNYGQDLFQVQYTSLVGDSSSIAAQVYYNGAQGWFRLWDDPVAKSNLLQYGINGQFIGAVLTYSTIFHGLNLTFGSHVNHFVRDHFQDIEDTRQYENTGLKNEGNAFVKAAYDFDRWHLYGDAQVRHAKFTYEGDLDLGSVDWTFFNPKIGARFDLTPGSGIYASVGHTGREPARQDMLLGEDNATVVHDLSSVKPESVTDFELGYEVSKQDLHATFNIYAMEFRNEIALTGELSDIGLPLRTNVDQSYRRGFEMDLQYHPFTQLRLGMNANLSSNQIQTWLQFYDVYDAEGNYVGSESRTHPDVNPLLTPRVILNPSVDYLPVKELQFSLSGHYASRSYLDNTNNDNFRTPSFFNLDAAFLVNLNRWWSAASPRIRLQVNNVLNNKRMWPSGYSYLFFVQDSETESLQGIPYFYPLATRTAVIELDFQL